MPILSFKTGMQNTNDLKELMEMERLNKLKDVMPLLS